MGPHHNSSFDPCAVATRAQRSVALTLSLGIIVLRRSLSIAWRKLAMSLAAPLPATPAPLYRAKSLRVACVQYDVKVNSLPLSVS